jgi:sec-independent protein translocase protein TatC
MPEDTTKPDPPTEDARPNEGEDPNHLRMSFGEHLEELRQCLLRAVVGTVLASIVCLIFAKDILVLLFEPLLLVLHNAGLPAELQALAPTAAFLAYVKIGFLSGLVVAMPWVLWQGWSFVAVGLYPRERRFVRLFAPVAGGLFALGVVFLYTIVLPLVLQFLVSFNRDFDMPNLTPNAYQRLLLVDQKDVPTPNEDASPGRVPILLEDPTEPQSGDIWVNGRERTLLVMTDQGLWAAKLEPYATRSAVHSQFAIDFYITFVLTLALAFGIAFELPIAVFFLAWTRLVSTETMAGGRRYVLLGIVALAAILTPPDVISQLLLAGPMYLLFEIGLFAARFAERKAAA